jgi:hypothetical protein
MHQQPARVRHVDAIWRQAVVIHASDTELRRALGEFGFCRDLIRAQVDAERVGADCGCRTGGVAEAAAELHVPIAGLEACTQKQCTGSFVVDLADRSEPRMTGLTRIEDVVVAVTVMSGPPALVAKDPSANLFVRLPSDQPIGQTKARAVGQSLGPVFRNDP